MYACDENQKKNVPLILNPFSPVIDMIFSRASRANCTLKIFRAFARGQYCSTLSLVARDAHPWDIKKHASTHALTLLWVETFSNAEMYYLWDCVNSTKQ